MSCTHFAASKKSIHACNYCNRLYCMNLVSFTFAVMHLCSEFLVYYLYLDDILGPIAADQC